MSSKSAGHCRKPFMERVKASLSIVAIEGTDMHTVACSEQFPCPFQKMLRSEWTAVG